MESRGPPGRQHKSDLSIEQELSGAQVPESPDEQFNSYAINLGSKIYNKKVNNINDQFQVRPLPKTIHKVQVPISYNRPHGFQKNFKEDQPAHVLQASNDRSLKQIMDHMPMVNSSLDEKGAIMGIYNARSRHTPMGNNPMNKMSMSGASNTEKRPKKGATSKLSSKQHFSGPLSPLQQEQRKSQKKYMNTEKRVKKMKPVGVNIFNDTRLDQMPSIQAGKSSKNMRQNLSTVHASTVTQSRPNLVTSKVTDVDFGIVNYLNGVPVSIQLPAGTQQSSWKHNMRLRNQQLDNNDVNKMHERNEQELSMQNGRLPQIKPGLKKEKMRFSVHKRRNISQAGDVGSSKEHPTSIADKQSIFSSQEPQKFREIRMKSVNNKSRAAERAAMMERAKMKT